ncbi:hypothetical protein BCY91_04510 [Pelobium manganitolerans]|uniref:Hemerythrin-like domain-containing protein n=1 Tax=Pelobium manganitolerans TaxID=1842495 RepID=A0A419S5M2_9SPHI|nr:hypothetical protein [Pelobium manganitolerans]RKD16150.1 hypothetical protein BCY91_04510 [Pelobium manganitolerans]
MLNSENSYIKRLSEDHRLEMAFCRHIEEGVLLNISLERIRDYIRYFWDAHLKDHFDEEEMVLLNLEDDFSKKAVADHQLIKAELEKIVSGKHIALHHFSELALLLRQHINFEERVLFPSLVLGLSTAQLDAIVSAKQGHTPSNFVDNYPDKFWIPAL